MKAKSLIANIFFWILAIISVPVGAYVSIVCYMSFGLGLYCNVIGMVAGFLGSFAIIVSIVCMVLGIIMLCRKKLKKAYIFVLSAIAFSVITAGGLFIDEAIDTIKMKKHITEYENQLYGENWNSPSALEGIPEAYQTELNKFYVAVRDNWSADMLGDLQVVTMAEHYGDSSLDNIGFSLTDLDGDGTDELIIGTVEPVNELGTAVFCIYSNPKNPLIAISSVDDETYYLHFSEEEGVYTAEVDGSDYSWRLEYYEGDSYIHVIYQELAIDPSGRLTLDMIPFSMYK